MCSQPRAVLTADTNQSVTATGSHARLLNVYFNFTKFLRLNDAAAAVGSWLIVRVRFWVAVSPVLEEIRLLESSLFAFVDVTASTGRHAVCQNNQQTSGLHLGGRCQK